MSASSTDKPDILSVMRAVRATRDERLAAFRAHVAKLKTVEGLSGWSDCFDVRVEPNLPAGTAVLIAPESAAAPYVAPTSPRAQHFVLLVNVGT